MSDQPKHSVRKDLRNNEREWTGMSAQHRQSSLKKPYNRTKEGNVWPFLKRLFIVIVILVLAQELYSMRQECMDILGENHILCMD